jgi:sodium-independent sulfate anion transporter 11
MDVETGIYVSVALSLLLMLLRLARPSVSSLGRVKLDSKQYEVKYAQPLPSSSSVTSTSFTSAINRPHFDPSIAPTTNVLDDVYGMNKLSRYIYVEENDSNYSGLLDPLPSGVVIIRLSNSILYPNANYVSECITNLVKSHTRAGNSNGVNIEEERTWNQPIRSSKEDLLHHHGLKPYLECIVFDFGAVDKLDATAIHILHTIQEALDRYAGGKKVEWHFCRIINNQVRQLLIQSNFGLLPHDEAETKAAADMKIDKEIQHVENSGNIENNIQQKQSTFGSSGDKSLQAINSLYDPMTAMTNEPHYTNVSAFPKYIQQQQQQDATNFIALLPADRYPAFHWDVESAIYSITERRQYAFQFQNNYSSITVTTTY